MIDRKSFIFVIENMRQQHFEDMVNADKIADIFKSDYSNVYDNSKLYKCIFDLLRKSFPKDADGHCELEHFCFVLDFGKHTNESADELYDRLTKN